MSDNPQERLAYVIDGIRKGHTPSDVALREFADTFDALSADLEAATRERDEWKAAGIDYRDALVEAKRERDEARQLLADRRATNDDIAEAAERALEAARDALREWKCWACNNGTGKERAWTDFGKDCHACNGTGLDPAASRALDASASTEGET